MVKYKIIVEYDGTNYYGWQIQFNGPTIQRELEKALFVIFCEEIKVIGAGRTDSGVHAKGQVAHFSCTEKMSSQRLLLGMNALLPLDISLRSIKKVPSTFHSILSAVSKTYKYTILNQPFKSALECRYSMWVKQKLSLEKMQKGAGFLVGKHDFLAFASTNSPRKSPIRTINKLSLRSFVKEGCSFIEIEINGDGFLYNMVRAISGTLIQVGKGKLEPERVKWILNSKQRVSAGPTAEAKALCLLEVRY